MAKDQYLSEVHRKKKLADEFIAHQFKAKGDEPNVEKISFRIPTSFKRRMDKFREENNRFPWDELRQHLDQILPPDPEGSEVD